MTIPYNATLFSCFKNFKEKLEKKGIEYTKLSKKEQKKLKDMHEKFYNTIKKDIKKEFYMNENGEMKKFSYSKYIIVSNKEYKVNYKKNRDKYIHT